MRQALFDTDVVSSWYDNAPEWRGSITAALVALGQHGTTVDVFVSAVTFQELLFHARTQNTHEAVEKWLLETFTPLAFDHEAAGYAAALEAAIGKPPKTKPGQAYRNSLKLWSHDCAILGTAMRHKMDVVVTADGGMYHQRDKYPRSILHLKENGIYDWGGYIDLD